MNKNLQRYVYPVIALIWAAVMLYFYTTGRVDKYLAPSFRPLCLIGGLGLFVIGAYVLATAKSDAACGHEHEDDDHAAGCDGHNHERGDMHPLTSAALMLTPLIFAVANTKDSYSLAALSRKALYDAPRSSNVFLADAVPPLTMEEIERSHRKNDKGEYIFNLLELYYAAGDPEMMKIMSGLKVETEGRLVNEKDQSGINQKRLYRLFITCCAADARALPILLDFTNAPADFKENEWVKVSGELSFVDEQGAKQAKLMIHTSALSEPPWEESFMRNQ